MEDLAWPFSRSLLRLGEGGIFIGACRRWRADNGLLFHNQSGEELPTMLPLATELGRPRINRLRPYNHVDGPTSAFTPLPFSLPIWIEVFDSTWTSSDSTW
jgi:hypothetical protein